MVLTVYLYYFLIFSFLGWMLEVAYAGVKCHRFVNRGFVLGPVCPIYGVCAMLLRLCLLPLTDRWLLLFLAAVIVLFIWVIWFASFLNKFQRELRHINSRIEQSISERERMHYIRRRRRLLLSLIPFVRYRK